MMMMMMMKKKKMMKRDEKDSKLKYHVFASIPSSFPT